MAQRYSGAPAINLVVRLIIRSLAVQLVVIPSTAEHEIKKVDENCFPLVVPDRLTKPFSFHRGKTLRDQTRHEPGNLIFGNKCRRNCSKLLEVAPKHAASVERATAKNLIG